MDAVAAVRESALEFPDLQLTDLISWASEDFGIPAEELLAGFNSSSLLEA